MASEPKPAPTEDAATVPPRLNPVCVASKGVAGNTLLQGHRGSHRGSHRANGPVGQGCSQRVSPGEDGADLRTDH